MSEINLDTTEKIISVIAGLVAIAGAILWFIRRRGVSSGGALDQPNAVSVPSQPVIMNTMNSTQQSMRVAMSADVADLKRRAQILFVDDDRGFKIVGVLKKMGWEHTKLVTDVSSLEQQQLLSADVVFVDIQGVGKLMQYSDEGLGLALAIKRRYPQKKVIIYSAEEKGARFHEALQEADYSLPKTAEPIRFEDTIFRVLTK
jgi:hypothetical protein